MTEPDERYANFPQDDPFPNGTVIVYDRNYPNSPTTYTYAAVKANGMWYVTGQSPAALGWFEFIYILSSSTASNIRIAIKFIDWDMHIATIASNAQRKEIDGGPLRNPLL